MWALSLNIKFYPHKTQGKCKIYARIRIGATKDFRLSTGLTIMNAKDWNKKTNLPKPSKVENKNLKSSLDNLHNKIHSYILDLHSFAHLYLQEVLQERKCLFKIKIIHYSLGILLYNYYIECINTYEFLRIDLELGSTKAVVPFTRKK